MLFYTSLSLIDYHKQKNLAIVEYLTYFIRAFHSYHLILITYFAMVESMMNEDLATSNIMHNYTVFEFFMLKISYLVFTTFTLIIGGLG